METNEPPRVFEKQIPIRQFCDICGHVDRVMFWVPDDMWFEVIPRHHYTSRVCLHCFTERADEKMVKWDKVIKLCPVSMATQVEIQVGVSHGEYKNGMNVWHEPKLTNNGN